MASVNRVTLIGNTGRVPEVKTFQDGTKNVTLTLATTERFKNRDGQVQERTEWHTVVCWRNLADIAEKWVNKGDLVYVEGKIRSREYEDRDGQKRRVYEIQADVVQNLTKKDVDRPAKQQYQNQYQQERPKPQQSQRVQEPDLYSEGVNDLPF